MGWLKFRPIIFKIKTGLNQLTALDPFFFFQFQHKIVVTQFSRLSLHLLQLLFHRDNSPNSSFSSPLKDQHFNGRTEWKNKFLSIYYREGFRQSGEKIRALDTEIWTAKRAKHIAKTMKAIPLLMIKGELKLDLRRNFWSLKFFGNMEERE